jgi:hypothetical protein
MYLYPREIIAETYVTKLGGFSEEISKDELAINTEALMRNTSIIIGETRARMKFLHHKNRPYFLRNIFKIVGFEGELAEELSPNGEAVLSEELKEKYERYLGGEVLINTVESFRIDDDFSEVLKAFLRSRWD